MCITVHQTAPSILHSPPGTMLFPSLPCSVPWTLTPGDCVTWSSLTSDFRVCLANAGHPQEMHRREREEATYYSPEVVQVHPSTPPDFLTQFPPTVPFGQGMVTVSHCGYSLEAHFLFPLTLPWCHQCPVRPRMPYRPVPQSKVAGQEPVAPHLNVGVWILCDCDEDKFS